MSLIDNLGYIQRFNKTFKPRKPRIYRLDRPCSYRQRLTTGLLEQRLCAAFWLIPTISQFFQIRSKSSMKGKIEWIIPNWRYNNTGIIIRCVINTSNVYRQINLACPFGCTALLQLIIVGRKNWSVMSNHWTSI